MRTFFVTYGDEHFQQSKARIIQQALAMSFDDARAYGPDDVSIPINRFTRGGGFCIWKPQVVKMTLDRMQDGDVLAYADSGCTLNIQAKDRLMQYFQCKNGVFFRSPQAYENIYTKEDIFQHYQVPDDVRTSEMIAATAFVLRKTPESIRLVDDWNSAPMHLFTDQFVHPNKPPFRDIRYDQSILSVLLKLKNDPSPFDIIADETWPLLPSFPMQASRIRN